MSARLGRDILSAVEGGDETCRCCGFSAHPVAGLTDPYGAATPSCWAAFGRLHVVGLSQLAVDSYMAQHPALSTAGGKRSVLTHLVGLKLALERGLAPRRIQILLGFVFPDKRIAPPDVVPVPVLAGVGVADVLDATQEERGAKTDVWARFVWSAWSAQHPIVATLSEAALKRCP